MTQHAWLIPLMPLVAFALIIWRGDRLPGRGASVSIAGIVLAGLGGLLLLGEVATGARADLTYRWVTLGTHPLTVGFVVDPLSAVMLAMVGVVASLITIYSVGYMHGDPRFSRFFAYLSLFQFSMLFLVLADNFLFIYAGWELVGLCSYLLIGFWFERPTAARAALKAFITTRVGDFSMMIGILILFLHTQTLNFAEVFKGIAAGQIGGPLLTLAAVLVFGGAVGKSAQVPLHVWLPDAMEGPTPVSALIHAATMVAAGVYLVARTFPLFILSPAHNALWVVAWIGGITALFAATMGVVEDDIKRVLAYSTVSQLGYMMMGLGVLGYSAGMFHLITHAFFKALLFLGAGSVIHAVATNNMKEMGGLAKAMPVTFWTFLVATLALTGIPPFSGFFSKDAILLAAYTQSKALWLIGTIGAFVTALYMGRLMWYTFAGSYRGGAAAAGDHDAHGGTTPAGGLPHESPQVMTVPLVILAVCSIFLGFLEHPFGRFVRFPGVEEPASNTGLLFFSVLVAVAGWLAAGAIYRWRIVPSAALRRWFAPLYTLLVRKYFVDDFYGWVFLRVGWGVIWLAGAFDRYVVDGLVNAVGWLAGRSGWFLRFLQTGREENYLLLIFLGVVVIVLVRLVR
ncbi:MAG TPA: NADH-quinone oxidoreductase subunit L [bacterium]|nr:NADH-quinone oxidoreductase subunit L [bacterium]